MSDFPRSNYGRGFTLNFGPPGPRTQGRTRLSADNLGRVPSAGFDYDAWDWTDMPREDDVFWYQRRLHYPGWRGGR